MGVCDEMSGRILRAASPVIRVTAAIALGRNPRSGLAVQLFLRGPGRGLRRHPRGHGRPSRAPLGDCYGGVLSHAPLHCYALEQAEAAGVIDVESIYLAGRRLYIFVGGEINEFASAPAVEWGYPTVRLIVNTGIGEKMKEYARLWPGRVRSEWLPPWPYVCDPTDSDADCLVKKLPMNVNAILDHVEGYDSLYLRAGTGEGRTAIRGWAGWTRLWPETAEEQDKSDRSTGQRDTPSVSFDVSDVDTTNFPEFDCSFVNLGESCGYWERSAATGVNGIVGVWIEGNDVYVQLKKDPEDPATFEAEKATILGRKRPEDRMVIIPVKYSLQELWKWGVILDRFAKSPGNTIGITGAKLRTMIYGGTYPAEVGLYRDVGTGEWIEGGGVKEYSLIRETVGVGVLDAYQVKGCSTCSSTSARYTRRRRWCHYPIQAGV